MSNRIGLLRLRVSGAEIYRNAEIRATDTYAEVSFNGEVFKTASFLDPRRSPTWSEEFPLHVTSMNDEVRIKIYDQESFQQNGLIGNTNIKVSLLCQNNGTKDWYTIDYNGKPAGKIFVETQYKPIGAQGMDQMYKQQQQQIFQQQHFQQQQIFQQPPPIPIATNVMNSNMQVIKSSNIVTTQDSYLDCGLPTLGINPIVGRPVIAHYDYKTGPDIIEKTSITYPTTHIVPTTTTTHIVPTTSHHVHHPVGFSETVTSVVKDVHHSQPAGYYVSDTYRTSYY